MAKKHKQHRNSVLSPTAVEAFRQLVRKAGTECQVIDAAPEGADVDTTNIDGLTEEIALGIDTLENAFFGLLENESTEVHGTFYVAFLHALEVYAFEMHEDLGIDEQPEQDIVFSREQGAA